MKRYHLLGFVAVALGAYGLGHYIASRSEYGAEVYHLRLTTDGVGCSAEHEGVRVLSQLDVNTQRIETPIVVLEFARSCRPEMLDYYAEVVRQNQQYSLEVLGQLSTSPHRRSDYGCRGSRTLKVLSIIQLIAGADTTRVAP